MRILLKLVLNNKRSLHEIIFFPIFKNNLCINWSVLHSGKKNAYFCIFNKIPANFHIVTLLQGAQKCNSAYATFKKHQYQIEQMSKNIMKRSDL